MKRYGNIYDKIFTIENLELAHKNARKGKTYYREVKMVDTNPRHYLGKIQEMFQNETYKVSDYKITTIIDKGKERTLYKLPYYPDRIIQWAIMLQVEHIFMKTFTSFSCASIKNRGIHKASKLVDKFMRDKEGTQYCLKMDVKKFYENISHEKLKSMLRKKIKDKRLLSLLDKIIESTGGGKGIPIGSYLSQFFANFYLTYFDHWLKEVKGCKYVVRYMDDIVILHNSKQWLHELKHSIDEYLDSELSLEIKGNWQVFPTKVRGIDFVGYRHFYKYKLLRKSTCNKYKKKMLSIKKKMDSSQKLTHSDWCSCNSYLGWVRWCNSFRLQSKYYSSIKDYVYNYYKYNIKKGEKK